MAAQVNTRINPLSPPGIRGVDARDIFVVKWETFNDELRLNFVVEANAMAEEMNDLAMEVTGKSNQVSTDANAVENNKNLTEQYRNETEGFRNEVVNLVIPEEATYDTDTINKKNADIYPFGGYCDYVSKDDNFVFGNIAAEAGKLWDKNRLINFGIKVSDTHEHSSFNPTKGGVEFDGLNFIPDVYVQDQATNGLITQQSVNKGDYVIVDRYISTALQVAETSNSVLTNDGTKFYIGQEVVVKPTSDTQYIDTIINITSNTLAFGSSRTKSAENYNVFALNEACRASRDTADMFDYNDVGIVATEIGDVVLHTGNNTVSGISGNYYKFVAAQGVQNLNTYDGFGTGLCIDLGTASNMSLRNSYFEIRDDKPISNTIAILQEMDESLKTYGALVGEVLLVDGLKIETAKALMLKNNFALVSEGIYSKNSKLYTVSSFYQTENKGLYHPELSNIAGSKKANDDKFWYDTTVSFNSLADCFKTSKLLTSSGNVSSGKSGRPTNDITPYHDIIYSNQTIDKREYSYKFTKTDLDGRKKEVELNGLDSLIAYNGTTTEVTGYLNQSEIMQIQILSDSTAFPTNIADRINESKLIFADYSIIDDESVSVIPNGILTTFKLNGKYKDVLEVIKWDGTTYTKLVLTTDYTLNTANNSITFTSAPLATDCLIVSYVKQNNCIELKTLTDYEVIEEDTYVYASNNNDIADRTVVLINNVANHISTGIDPIEQLTITKIINNIVSQTAKTATVDATIRRIIAKKDGELYFGCRADVGDTATIDLTDDIWVAPLGVKI